MKYSFLVFFIIILFSCKHPVQEDNSYLITERNRKKEALINLNRYATIRNQELIERFIERSGWKMKKTETGLWYEIYDHGKGKPVKAGNTISYLFTASLLDGTFCDSASLNNPAKIKLGRGSVVSGLEEAFLLMKEGDKAHIIIPPHLAHGNFGEGSKYPPGAIILYDISLLTIY